MPYSFRGNLRAYLCDECREPLRGVIVRLYRADREVLPDPAPDRDPVLLDARQAEGKSGRLLGEARTGDDGSFVVRIDERQQGYDGGEIEVHVRVEGIEPGQKHDPVQFVAARVSPEWVKGREGYAYDWRFVIAARIWCFVRRWFDAWVICGRLVTCREKIPVAGATVRAYDADWLQDDALGVAVTDASGHFTLHYTSAQFRKTPFSPGINVELAEGPDLYFKATLGATVLLNETQADGRRRRREDVGHCYCADLCTDKANILACAVTGPTGCVHGHTGLLPDKVLEIVTGTAAGTIFDHYELELVYGGSVIAGGIIYPDAGGNPDAAATQGTNQVVSGTLGFVDLFAAASGAGAGISSSTTFTLSMRVFGTGGQVQLCTRTISVPSAQVYIRSIGAAPVADWVPPAAHLQRGGATASIGGSVTVRGAADVYGCTGEKIAGYRLFVQDDPTFSLPQPGPGDPLPAGWTQITAVAYATDDERDNNRLDGDPDPDILTRGAWGMRQKCVYFDGLPFPVCFSVPDLPATTWGTPASGRYSVLLQVTDTAGLTRYDIQRLWVDNHDITVSLTGLGGLPACTDLFTQETAGVFRTVAVNGTAWDELIVPGDTSVPSNNFDHYTVHFQKQGAAGWAQLIDSSTSIPAAGNPVGVGVLVDWDLQTVDAASNPLGLSADQLLAPGEACSYVLMLQAWDNTLVGESTVHYHWDLFPVKIINAPIA